MRLMDLERIGAYFGLGVRARVSLSGLGETDRDALIDRLRLSGYEEWLPETFEVTAETEKPRPGGARLGMVGVDRLTGEGPKAYTVDGYSAQLTIELLMDLDGHGVICVPYSEPNLKHGIFRRAIKELGEGSEGWILGLLENEEWESGSVPYGVASYAAEETIKALVSEMDEVKAAYLGQRQG